MLPSADSRAVLCCSGHPISHAMFWSNLDLLQAYNNWIQVHNARWWWYQPKIMTSILYHSLQTEIQAVNGSAVQILWFFLPKWLVLAILQHNVPMILSIIGIVTVLSNSYLCGNNWAILSTKAIHVYIRIIPCVPLLILSVIISASVQQYVLVWRNSLVSKNVRSVNWWCYVFLNMVIMHAWVHTVSTVVDVITSPHLATHGN